MFKIFSYLEEALTISKLTFGFELEGYSATEDQRGINAEIEEYWNKYLSEGVCPRCNGKGNLSSGKSCPVCKGDGTVVNSDISKGDLHDDSSLNGDDDSYENCETCNGTGSEECETCDGNGTVNCPECDGTGSVEVDNEDDEDGGTHSIECVTCDGNGRINCSDCDGEGRGRECYNCGGSGRQYISSEDISFEWSSPPLNVTPKNIFHVVNFLHNLVKKDIIYTNEKCGFHIHLKLPFDSSNEYKGLSAEYFWFLCQLSQNMEIYDNKIKQMESMNFEHHTYASASALRSISEVLIESDYKNEIELFNRLSNYFSSSKFKVFRLHPQGTLEWRGPRTFLNNGSIQIIKTFFTENFYTLCRLLVNYISNPTLTLHNGLVVKKYNFIKYFNSQNTFENIKQKESPLSSIFDRGEDNREIGRRIKLFPWIIKNKDKITKLIINHRDKITNIQANNANFNGYLIQLGGGRYNNFTSCQFGDVYCEATDYDTKFIDCNISGELLLAKELEVTLVRTSIGKISINSTYTKIHIVGIGNVTIKSFNFIDGGAKVFVSGGSTLTIEQDFKTIDDRILFFINRDSELYVTINGVKKTIRLRGDSSETNISSSNIENIEERGLEVI